jgi:hypothetical protein
MSVRVQLLSAVTCAGVALGGAAAVARPTPLTDSQLDRVTAGFVTVVSSTDAAAVGPLSMTGTTSNVIAGQHVSPTAPDIGASAGFADGTAVAVGTNTAFVTAPTGAATNVQTAGVVDGGFQINSSVNRTVQGAGGVQFQAGWTFVFGTWLGL